MSVDGIYARINDQLPAARRFIEENRDRSLLEISRLFHQGGPEVSETAMAAIELEAGESIDRQSIEEMRRYLASGGGVSSAGHHGVESYPEMAQGGLIFALEAIDQALAGRPAPPLVVLACENVPINSATCPGGFLFGRRREGDRFHKIHLFKRSYDRCCVGQAPPLSVEDLESFLVKTERSDLYPWEKTAVKKIMEPLAADDFFLGSPGFKRQAVIINQRLWASRFRKTAPELAFLSMEAVVSRCLGRDMADNGSLAYSLIFDRRAREYVLERLCGFSGCWHRSLLHQPGGVQAADRSRHLGTVFFWGTGSVGRLEALGISLENGEPWLCGSSLRLRLQPEELIEALLAGKIIPGLFLSFATLVSGHGLRTHGGVYMMDYLPRMLEPVTDIAGAACARPWTIALAAGLLPLKFDAGESGPAGPYPAGALEMVAAGPFDQHFFKSLGEVGLDDIWPFSASEWYLEETRPEQRQKDWAVGLDSLRRRTGGIVLAPK